MAAAESLSVRLLPGDTGSVENGLNVKDRGVDQQSGGGLRGCGGRVVLCSLGVVVSFCAQAVVFKVSDAHALCWWSVGEFCCTVYALVC